VGTSTYAGAGKKTEGDQSPKRRGGEVASKELDLARVDGMAGVRKGHKSMGGVRRWERGEAVDERWR